MLILNLKRLREQKKHSQDKMASILGISRSTYNNYEKGKHEPPASILLKIAKYHKVSIDGLLTKDLVAPLFNQKPEKEDSILFDNTRILPITISANKQNTEFVPAKAIAGYVESMNSQSYITELPKIHIPKLSDGSYRAFEIQGNSMPPIQDGYIVIGRFVEHARNLKNGIRYILVLREDGIVFKKINCSDKQNKKLILTSDNPEFQPSMVDTKNVLEAWEFVAFIGYPDKIDMNYIILDKLHDIEQQLALLNS